jgi:hypothetical protein
MALAAAAGHRLLVRLEQILLEEMAVLGRHLQLAVRL